MKTAFISIEQYCMELVQCLHHLRLHFTNSEFISLIWMNWPSSWHFFSLCFEHRHFSFLFDILSLSSSLNLHCWTIFLTFFSNNIKFSFSYSLQISIIVHIACVDHCRRLPFSQIKPINSVEHVIIVLVE